MVHGKPRHNQSQGSVERANRDIAAHSGPEGGLGQRKLIIDMPYIFEMVKQNAIQIH